MKAQNKVKHKFVEFIPDKLDEATIYVSMEFATVCHTCCCGCGVEVVTPLSPTDWKLLFDGSTISIIPSIGNWGFECQSHYWITRNEVNWARQWSQAEISAGRSYDRQVKWEYSSSQNGVAVDKALRTSEMKAADNGHLNRWQKFRKWLWK